MTSLIDKIRSIEIDQLSISLALLAFILIGLYLNIDLFKDTHSNIPIISILFIIIGNVLCQYKKLEELKQLIINPKDLVPFAEQIQDSKFEFEKMVSDAKASIFIIGPNLTFLSKKNEWKHFQTLLFRKLKDNPKFEVRMLLMDPKNDTICKFMCEYAFTASFLSELYNSVFIFSRWMDDVQKEKLKNLEIKVTEVVTLSLLFIDVKERNGRVLVTPIVPETEGKSRSSFLIKKEDHLSVFYQYYNLYSSRFYGDSRSIKCAFNDIPDDIATKMNNNYFSNELPENEDEFIEKCF